MKELVFLLEEPSARALLESLLPRHLQAVEQALGIAGLASQQQSRKFRNPDRLGSPSRELKVLTRNAYEKVAGSRAMGQHLLLDNMRSASFRNLIAGIRRMENELVGLEA